MSKQTPSSPEIHSFGCRLNIHESQIMVNHATQAGFDNQTILINSCAVTAQAERQLQQKLRKLRKDNPEKKIILSGCAAQISPQYYHDSNLVDAVIGNDEKLKLASYQQIAGNKSPTLLVNDTSSMRETALHLIDNIADKTRAFVQIQNGCDHDCTFCIIPQGRGKSRAIALKDILTQIEHLCKNNVKEVILCGVDLTSWQENNKSLGHLVTSILDYFPELPRLRVSSLDCIEIDDDLRDAFANEHRLMPHIHLSVQSGDDMVLKRMKRRHNRQDIIDLCRELKQNRCDIIFGADIIAGFPTEDDAMFQHTLDLVHECGFALLHVFPYSPRPNTPAAKIPNDRQVPIAKRKERAKILREAGRNILLQQMHQQIGTIQHVLFEQHHQGRTPHFFYVKHENTQQGDILSIKLTDVVDDGKQPYFIGDAV